MLIISELSIKQQYRWLFQSISFSLQPGEVLQILGGNGVGKTTLLRIICGLIQADNGQVLWLNENIQQNLNSYQSCLVYIGHQLGLNGMLTPYENLSFYQRTIGQSSAAIHWILDSVGLANEKDIPLVKLSAGQQRRTALARLWLYQRPLWILDEPFTSIDQQGIEQLLQLFSHHVARGGMIMLTSHQAVPMAFTQLRHFRLINGELMQ